MIKKRYIQTKNFWFHRMLGLVLVLGFGTLIPGTTLAQSGAAPAAAVVTIVVPQTDGSVITSADQTRFQATAYNPSVGTTDGAGIQTVAFEVYSPTNVLLQSATDSAAPYCFFGDSGSCNAGNSTAQAPAGTYTLRARAQTTNGVWSNWVSRTFVIGTPATPTAPTATPLPPTVTNVPPPTTLPPTVPPATAIPTLPPTAPPVIAGTTLQVNPVPNSATVGQQVTVSLQLANAVNLYGLAVQCTVNPQVLKGVAKVDGAGFNASNSFFVDKGFNAATGSWTVGASRLRPQPAISGSITAFGLTYAVQNAGSSSITCLAEGSDLSGNKVPITVFNSQINGSGNLPTATPPPTSSPLPPTPTIPATATLLATPTLAPTIAGLGTITGTIVEQGAPDQAGITVSLLDAQQKPVTNLTTNADGSYRFTNVPLGSYFVVVLEANHLPFAQAVSVKTSGQVLDLGRQLLIAGDTDNNRIIDLADASFVAANFDLQAPPAPDAADLNHDLMIDVRDLALVGGNFGLKAALITSTPQP